MDYRYLKAFMVTAKLRNFTAAAKELGISQSAVSRQIKLLEMDVQTELLVRSSKMVLLTPEGEDLYGIGLGLESKISDVFQGNKIRTIRLGILQGVLEYGFAPLLKSYYDRHLHHLAIRVGMVEELKGMLHNGTLDFTILTENIQSEMISSIQLFQEKFLLIGKGEVDMDKLWQYRWIVYSKDDDMFKISKRPSASIITVNSVKCILDLVGEGVGIAVVPAHTMERKMKQEKGKIKFTHTLPTINKGRGHIYLAMSNYRKLPAYLKEFRDLLVKFYKV